MPDKDLPKLTEIINTTIPYLYFIFLAIWGGIVNYILRIRKSKIAFSTIELVGEMFVSGFAGLMSAYLCIELDLSFAVTCAISGVAGHMGGRTIFLMESWLQRRYFLHKDKGQ